MDSNNLDKRICDIEPKTKNTDTYREFIRKSEDEFAIAYAPIDEFTEDELADYMDWLDLLWDK